MDGQVPCLERCSSVLLCGMIGDALGAPVEGWPASMIRKVYGKVDKYYEGVPLGVLDSRRAMYTDDTNCALSLAASIVRMNGKIDVDDCAKAHVEFWKHTPKRGCPDSAEAIIKALDSGADPRNTGTIAFPDGSFANGGAMKIGPVGVICRDVDDETLYSSVTSAILATHVHPEAIDGAYIIAKAVVYLLRTSVESFDPSKFLHELEDSCRTAEMKKRISLLRKHINRGTFDSVFCGLGGLKTNPGKESYGEMSFQIKAVVAVACALWAFAGSWKNPLDCLVNAISWGGDTDTIATMVGYLVGALHGSEWIPPHLFNELENGEFGRDYCIQLSLQLSALSLQQ